MFRKHILLKLVIIALLVTAGLYIAASATAGDSGDPLISLSYFNNVIKPEIMEKVSSLTESAKAEVEASFSNTLNQFKNSISSNAISNGLDSLTGDYETTTLEEGKVITIEEGCEFLFISGSATVSGSLTDTTAGTAITEGSLQDNHLYLTIGTVEVTAVEECKLLVKGKYSE